MLRLDIRIYIIVANPGKPCFGVSDGAQVVEGFYVNLLQKDIVRQIFQIVSVAESSFQVLFDNPDAKQAELYLHFFIVVKLAQTFVEFFCIHFDTQIKFFRRATVP